MKRKAAGIIFVALSAVIAGFALVSTASSQPPDVRIIYVTETHVNEVIRDRIVTRYDGAYQTYEVTSYTAGPESTGKTPADPLYGITASGLPVEAGTTAACPPSLPFGTRIYVPALDNVYTCTDRGAAITEGHLDLYTPGLDDALAFGRRALDVLILGVPPEQPPMIGENKPLGAKESIE